jgi:cyclohexadieny/prephenate dehydrogenase
MSKPLFETVALIGIGLIGSSISHATRRAGLARRIVGHAQSEATRQIAVELGLVDAAFATAAGAAAEADLVVLCTPVGACGPVAESIAGRLQAGTILTDVGSVKGAVVRDVAPHVPPGVHFIPGHPIAGTEHSGPRSITTWCWQSPATFRT